MGAQVGGSGRGIVGINMTPLVDIMLVLLIIFLVATQAVDSAAVPVRLPKASNAAGVLPPTVAVTLDAAGSLRIDGRAADRPGLRQFLTNASRLDTALQVVLAADERLPYARVMDVLDDVRGAGVRNYALKVRSSGSP